MQILVDLANLTNARSVRRPHALDPGHDLPIQPPVSLTIATVYPVPSQNRTVSGASPPPAATRRARIRMPLSSLDVKFAKKQRNPGPTNSAMVKDHMSEIRWIPHELGFTEPRVSHEPGMI